MRGEEKYQGGNLAQDIYPSMRVEGNLWANLGNPCSDAVTIKTAVGAGTSKYYPAILYKHEECKYKNKTEDAWAANGKCDSVQVLRSRSFWEHFWIWDNLVAHT